MVIISIRKKDISEEQVRCVEEKTHNYCNYFRKNYSMKKNPDVGEYTENACASLLSI